MKEAYSESNADKICNNNNKRLKCYCKKISFKGNLFLKLIAQFGWLFFSCSAEDMDGIVGKQIYFGFIVTHNFLII